MADEHEVAVRITADASDIKRGTREASEAVREIGHASAAAGREGAHGLEELNNEVYSVLSTFRQLVEGITGVREAFGRASEAFAAMFAVDKLKEFVEYAAEAGEEIDHMAHYTGLSVEQVQRLQGIARIAGLDVDTLTHGLARS